MCRVVLDRMAFSSYMLLWLSSTLLSSSEVELDRSRDLKVKIAIVGLWIYARVYLFCPKTCMQIGI